MAETSFMKAVALDISAKERIERAKDDVAREIAKRNSEAEARLLNSKAWQMLLAGKPAEGLNDAEGAVARAPEDHAILDTRGQIYLALGRFDEALADLNKAITSSTQWPGTYYARGVIYEKRGQIALAIADYRRSIELSALTEGDDGKWEIEAQAKAKARLSALEWSATPITASPADR